MSVVDVIDEVVTMVEVVLEPVIVSVKDTMEEIFSVSSI